MKPQATSTQQILQACRQIVRAQGLGSISIRSAAAASGVAVGTIYHYFPSKEALLLAVTADVWSQIFGLADDEGEQEGQPGYEPLSGEEGQPTREVQPGPEGQPTREVQPGPEGQSAREVQPGPEGQPTREVQLGPEGQPSCESHAESLPARSFVSYVQQMFEGARSRLQQYPGFLGAHAVNLGLYGGGNKGGHRRAGCMSGSPETDAAAMGAAAVDTAATDAAATGTAAADANGVRHMRSFFARLRGGLADALARDSCVRADAFGSQLTSEEFVGFVLQNILLLLVTGQESCHTLLAVIQATIY